MSEQLSSDSAAAGLRPLGPDPLAWVLGVSDSTPFLEHDFRQRWFHAPSEDRGRFADLLSLSDLDDVLGRFGVRFPQIKLVNAGGPVPSAEYLWRDNMVDPTRVAQLFSEGATVIFGGTMVLRETEFGRPVEAVVMAQEVQVLSAPSTQGGLTVFTLHAGTKVRVDQRANEWAEVVLADGKVGWLPLDVLALI